MTSSESDFTAPGDATSTSVSVRWNGVARINYLHSGDGCVSCGGHAPYAVCYDSAGDVYGGWWELACDEHSARAVKGGGMRYDRRVLTETSRRWMS